MAQPINTQTEKPKYTVANSLTNYYLVIMFSFFPLFLTDQYAHARTDKYWIYLIASAALVISVGLCMFVSQSEAKRSGADSPLFLPLSVTDIFMLAFLGLAAVSTLLSAHMEQAFLGTGGRNNGLLLLLMYTLMYFILTRNYVQKNYVFIFYLVVSSVVALLTVLNFFYIDPLGMLDGYDEATAADFGSTLGNKNIIAAFMCLFLPVCVMLFVFIESKVLRIISGFSIVFAYTGLLCADSTSDILGLLVILPVMAIFSARSFQYLKRYLLALTILFASGKLLMLFATAVGDHNKGFEFMQEFLIYHPATYAPIVICCLGCLLMAFLGRNGEPRYPAKAIQITLIALFSLGIITLLGLFIHFSFIDTETDIGDFEKLLRFDDYWGTHRGFMWRVSFEEFARFDPLRMLFGSGPDTAYYVLEPHFEELLDRFGDASTDCAHNEYINYLLTQGVLGLGAYLGVMISAIIRSIKTAKRNPMVLIFIAPVICYLTQSAVNLYNPIVTPTMFIFLSLAEATCRSEESGMRNQE
ncbi:MAG: O-antigen ligase family protein [Ruminococcus sp.]|nr:O-antigen ligase family protein [Ruminococcus sp.]